jgi:hypothetical protein
MDRMPANIINKIIFFTSHPVAEIMKESPVFEYMNLRLNPDKTGEGSPYRAAVAKSLADSYYYRNRDGEFDYCDFKYHNNLIREDSDHEDCLDLDFNSHVEFYLTFYHGKRRPFTKASLKHYKKLGLEVDWKIQKKRPFVPKPMQYSSDSEPYPDSDSD